MPSSQPTSADAPAPAAPASAKDAPTSAAAHAQSAASHPSGAQKGGEAAAGDAAPVEKKDEGAKEAGEKKEEEDGADEDEGVDVGPPSSGSVVDMEVFGQLLEIDDDESHEFSKGLAFDYIKQAEATFGEIEEALSTRDLDALSRKGHFLKGSSAALGLQRVQHSCEAMQHYGKRRDARGEGPEVSEDEALARCRVLLRRLKDEQKEAKEWLEAFYDPK
ncbi:hypothetical protein JCM8097_000455 [Rhodosporidiobolus ruineniae]